MSQEYTTEEYWNQRAKQHKGDPQRCLFNDRRFPEYEKRVIRALKGLIEPGHEVLDIACGYGRLIPHIRSLGGVWHGIDFSSEMKKQALESYPDCADNYLLGNAANPRYEMWENKFDLILEVNSSKVLQLSPVQFLLFYRRFLKPSGSIACLECDQFTTFQYYASEQ